MKRSLLDLEEADSLSFSQSTMLSCKSNHSQKLSQSSPNLSQENKAVNKERNKIINYVPTIIELSNKTEGCVDVIGVLSERGKLETRTNRNGETIYWRNLLLQDATSKVVVRLNGQIAQDFGNCDGFPVVSIENCEIKKLRKLPNNIFTSSSNHAGNGNSSLEFESDIGSMASTPTSEVTPPFQCGSPGKKKSTNRLAYDEKKCTTLCTSELVYCEKKVMLPLESENPRKRQKPNYVSENECNKEETLEVEQNFKDESAIKEAELIISKIYLLAKDSSSIMIDPVHDKTLDLHIWFQSHQRKQLVHDNPGSLMDTSSNQELLILPKIPDITQAEDVYPMNSKPRGQALIINIQDFIGEPLNKRYGSEMDAINLAKVLHNYLGFEVTQLTNLTKKDFFSALNNFSQNSAHLVGSMAVIAIFSHGTWSEGSTDGYITPTDYLTTGYIRIEDIYRIFNNKNCPNLVHKPKWFVFQCCRGHEVDYGIFVQGRATTKQTEMQSDASLIDNPEEPKSFLILPTYHDFLISHSTLPGFTSSRSPSEGSWFIQTLLEVFTKYLPILHTMELVRLLRKVERKLGEKTREDNEKQTCETRHFGLKEIYFDNWDKDDEKVETSCSESCPW